MSEYLLMVFEDETAHASRPPKAVADQIAEEATFAEGLRRAGKLKDQGRLRPSKEGKRVRKVGERVRVEEGPFAEQGRVLGSYAWLEASDREHAGELARSYPVHASDAVEIRPIMKGRVEADKDHKPGKIFAFGVLGAAENEEGWVTVMDRVEAETRDRFGGEGFLGGLRLEPPRTGQRVAPVDGRRAMFDGPFLESKEVIGGLFFIRMRSMDEAVRWASESRFVIHGVLEIRELWRI